MIDKRGERRREKRIRVIKTNFTFNQKSFIEHFEQLFHSFVSFQNIRTKLKYFNYFPTKISFN